jgi:hypothetical protein
MRIFSLTLTGMAAAAVIGAATAASAQDPVRVRKEMGGQVVMRVDTIALRVDTVALDTIFNTRVDTVQVDRIVVQTDTVIRVDTVWRDPDFGLSNYYWGLGGGGAFPDDNLTDGFDTGWNASLFAGWRLADLPWGIRLDAQYNQLAGETFGAVRVDDASVWSGMLDATFDVPTAAARSAGLYLLGGIGVHRLDDFDLDEEDFDIDGDGEIDEPEFLTESSTNFGVNAGLGFRFPVGGANLYLEGRWVNIYTEGTNSRYFPVTLGFMF